MIMLVLEDASVGIVLEGLAGLSEEAQINADEGGSERIATLIDEIEKQKGAQA